MNRALLLVVLAACERKGVRLHVPPQTVGARSTYHMRVDGSIKSPDGVDHGMHHELSLIFVVETLRSNGHADRIRVTVDRDDNVFDGQPEPTLSGTYEANADGTATRADGKPLTADEADVFRQMAKTTNDPAAMGHEFRAGETFRPTEREALAFGLVEAKTPVTYTVKRASDAEIVLEGEFTPAESPQDAEAHGHEVITMSPLSHKRVGDITLTRNGADAGAIHMTAEMRRLPQR